MEKEEEKPSYIDEDGDKYYPRNDCYCSLCRSGEHCDACEDFGCQIDDFAV